VALVERLSGGRFTIGFGLVFVWVARGSRT